MRSAACYTSQRTAENRGILTGDFKMPRSHRGLKERSIGTHPSDADISDMTNRTGSVDFGLLSYLLKSDVQFKTTVNGDCAASSPPIANKNFVPSESTSHPAPNAALNNSLGMPD